LEEARLSSNPQLRPRILIGCKSPKRILSLVARYADIWNCEGGSPELFRQLSTRLDDLVIAQGRVPNDIKRTITVPMLCFRNPEDKRDAFNFARRIPLLSSSSDEDLEDMLISSNGILGRTDEVIEKLQAYAQAGVEEFVILWFWVDYLDGINIIAKEIIPHFIGNH